MKFIPRNFSVLHSWKKPPVNPIALDKVVLQAKEFLNSNYVAKNDDPFSVSSSLSSSSRSMLLTLFSNQSDLIQSWMEKLQGSKHPVVNLAKEFCRENFPSESQTENDNGSAQALSSLSNQLRAIIVLLVSRSIGFPTFPVKVPQNEGQKYLGEVTELMHAAYILHQTVLDVPKLEDIEKANCYQNEQNNSSLLVEKEGAKIVRPFRPSNEVLSKHLSLIHDGNNVAVLMGDLLLAKSSGGLSNIKNSRVTELMSDTISDFAESQFVAGNSTEATAAQQLQQTKETKIDASLRGINRHTWLRKNQLGTGSLLGHACYCSLLLAGHDESVRQLGYRLGEKLGLLLQASKEISFFLQEDELLDNEQDGTVENLGAGVVFGKRNIPLHFDLCTLPVINALELQTISLERLQLLKSNFFAGYSQIYNEIQSCQNEESIERLKEALCNLQNDCMKIVSQLQPQSKLDTQSSSPPIEATRILTDIIHSLSPL